MNKSIIVITLITMFLIVGCSDKKYTYIGKIKNIEGGSSNQLLVLTLDNGQKTPYTTQRDCSNKIRLGQSVYTLTKNNYLWVEYDVGKFC